MDRKLRILWCGESSYLNTGYGVYAKEVLSRLYATGKYDIAELGCYGAFNSEKRFDVPWRLYSNLPTNDLEARAYESSPLCEFGEWRFEDVCLDFRPDVVIDIRDWWMSEFQERSPFRPFFHWVLMPTVDSYPQQEQYISTYTNADAVFTYSEFGRDVIEKESGHNVKISGIAPPGADFKLLQPCGDKNAHRKKYGFMDDINIVGTVMRNQRRKLYPNLIRTFRSLLDKHPQFSKNTFLYLHTSHPDIGWDIPYLIRENNMGNHTLLTYCCGNCKYFFPSFFQDSVMACPRCGRPEARLPNTQMGVTTEQFNEIYNWFDIYVQYSICEGFGMPQVEAAACGLPIITVDYSAMQSVGRNLKADLVEVESLHRDAPTLSWRANPSDKDLEAKLVKLLSASPSIRMKKGMDAYRAARRFYNWDRTAQIWESYLDKVQIRPHSETWDSPPRIAPPNMNPQPNLTNEEFVRWAVLNTWREGNKMNSYVALRMLRDLNYGRIVTGAPNIHYDELSFMHSKGTFMPFTRQDLLNRLKDLCERRNYWERRRCGIDCPPKPFFVQTAKPSDTEIEEIAQEQASV